MYNDCARSADKVRKPVVASSVASSSDASFAQARRAHVSHETINTHIEQSAVAAGLRHTHTHTCTTSAPVQKNTTQSSRLAGSLLTLIRAGLANRAVINHANTNAPGDAPSTSRPAGSSRPRKRARMLCRRFAGASPRLRLRASVSDSAHQSATVLNTQKPALPPYTIAIYVTRTITRGQRRACMHSRNYYLTY